MLLFKQDICIYVLIFSVFLGGCGQYDQSTAKLFERRSEESITYLFDKAGNFFKENFGVSSEGLFGKATVHIGSSEKVSSVCGPEMWSCNINHRLVIRDDGNFCEMVLHELGHTASMTLFQNWDKKHKLLSDYYFNFVFEACSEF